MSRTQSTRPKRSAAKGRRAAKAATIIPFPCPPGTADRLSSAEQSQRWFIGMSSSCRRYLVPADRRDEFESWADLDEDLEASWATPPYAYELEGEYLEFSSPTVNDQPIEDLMAKSRKSRGGAA